MSTAAALVAGCPKATPIDTPVADAAAAVSASAVDLASPPDASLVVDASADVDAASAVVSAVAGAAALASAIAALPDAASIPYVNIGPPNGGLGSDGRFHLRKPELDRLERYAKSDGGSFSP